MSIVRLAVVVHNIC